MLSQHAMRAPMPLHARCAHCHQTVIDECKAVANAEVRRLREHLLGCPSAIAAVAPALPVAATRDDLLKHFVVEELRQ
jgi:hypothetical protein